MASQQNTLDYIQSIPDKSVAQNKPRRQNIMSGTLRATNQAEVIAESQEQPKLPTIHPQRLQKRLEALEQLKQSKYLYQPFVATQH
jgi:hypothetical protein